MRNKSEFRTSVEFTTDESEKKVIKGYFAKFNSETELWADCYEKIARGAFSKSLNTNNSIRCLFNHNTDIVLGNTTNSTLILREDEIGLYGEVVINEKDTEALNIYERVKRKDITGCSFGFYIDDLTEEIIDGKRHITLLEVDLFEVSICTFPAYETTIVEARAKEYTKLQKSNIEERKKGVQKKLERIMNL